MRNHCKPSPCLVAPLSLCLCGFGALACSAETARIETSGLWAVDAQELGTASPWVLNLDATPPRANGQPADVGLEEHTLDVRFSDASGEPWSFELNLQDAPEGAGNPVPVAEVLGAAGVLRRGATDPRAYSLEVRRLLESQLQPDNEASSQLQFELVDEWVTGWNSGRTSDLALLGSQLALVARGPDGLRVVAIDAEDGTLSEVSHIYAPSGDDYNDVAVLRESYALIASKDQGLVIVDLADAEHPEIVGAGLPEMFPRWGHNLFVDGDRVFLAQAGPAQNGLLSRIDFDDSLKSRLVWQYELPTGGSVHDVWVAGDKAYVASTETGLLVLELDGDAPPQLLYQYAKPKAHSPRLLPEQDCVLLSFEQFGGALQCVEPESNEALWTYPEQDPQGASELARDRPPAASVHKFECTLGRCYIASYQRGLRVIDVTGDDQAREIGQFATWQPSPVAESEFLRGATGVALDLPRVYVADTERGLLALRERD